jgi:hypothetical protein
MSEVLLCRRLGGRNQEGEGTQRPTSDVERQSIRKISFRQETRVGDRAPGPQLG